MYRVRYAGRRRSRAVLSAVSTTSADREMEFLVQGHLFQRIGKTKNHFKGLVAASMTWNRRQSNSNECEQLLAMDRSMERARIQGDFGYLWPNAAIGIVAERAPVPANSARLRLNGAWVDVRIPG